ncbi:MAG: CsiV family protein [Woeseiaceae bacterium]
MMVLLRIWTILPLWMLPPVAAQAQDDLADESLETRRYTVEMIIFRYAQAVSTGSEIFVAERPAVDKPIIDDEPLLIDGEVLEEIPLVYRDMQFTLLPREQYTMGNVMDRLRRLDVYEPLMHFAWTQATWPDRETLPIDLRLMGRPPSGLDGTLRLYLSRYLHLVVDLKLDAPGENLSSDDRSAAALDYDDRRRRNEATLADEPYNSSLPDPVRYRIEENRILRSDELRYFDHPQFGVLAKVIRVEDEPEAAPDAAESELLGYPE